MELKPKVKISTITMSSNFPNCNLLLTNIGKYLDISDKIIGIKYCFGDLNVISKVERQQYIKKLN